MGQREKVTIKDNWQYRMNCGTTNMKTKIKIRGLGVLRKLKTRESKRVHELNLD